MNFILNLIFGWCLTLFVFIFLLCPFGSPGFIKFCNGENKIVVDKTKLF